VHNPLVLRLVNTGFQILVGGIHISRCNQWTSLKSVPCVISSMTLLMVSATLDIVTTRIGSRADISAGCLWSGVDWICKGRQGTEFNLWSGYHFHCLLTMPGKLLCAKITHSSRVFSHTIDSGKLITTFSVTNWKSIATVTEEKVFPRLISSATCAPGISASRTHLLMMNRMDQTWCTKH